MPPFHKLSPHIKAVLLRRDGAHRICRTMHECCLCDRTIYLNDPYFDKGYGKRGHTQCVRRLLGTNHET